MLIQVLETLNNSMEQQLQALVDESNGYEPYYNCGYPHVVAFADNSSILIGLLSFLPDEQDGSRKAELSALVATSYRQNGIFTAMLEKIRPVLKEYGIAETYCALPVYMLASDIHSGILYTEYLMQLNQEAYLSLANTENVSPDDTTNLEFYFSDDQCTYMGYLPDGDEPVCVCSLDYEPSFTNVHGVYVDEKLRHCGIGTLLMNNLIKDYFEDETLPLILNVSSTNAAAVKLYKKCGFTEASHISYYIIA